MKLEELGQKIREIIPGAVFGEENDGQLVIYTNLTYDENDNVIPFDTDEEPAH